MGWMTFDPTFGVPPAEPSWGSRFVAPEVIAAIGRAVAGVVPPSVRSAVADAVAVGRAPRYGTPARSSRRSSSRPWPSRSSSPRGDDAGVGVTPARPTTSGGPSRSSSRRWAHAGHPRAPSATPREYLAEVRADDALDGETRTHASLVIATLERERFAPPGDRPSEADVMRALAAAARVRDLVARR